MTCSTQSAATFSDQLWVEEFAKSRTGDSKESNSNPRLILFNPPRGSRVTNSCALHQSGQNYGRLIQPADSLTLTRATGSVCRVDTSSGTMPIGADTEEMTYSG